MKLQQFNGGLNTRLHPSYIQQNEAVEYTNIDNAVGTLRSTHAAAITDIVVNENNVYFDAKDMWVSFDNVSYTAEYSNVLHICDGINTPKSFNGTTYYNMAIEAPSTAVTVEQAFTAPDPVSNIDVRATVVTTATALRGTTQYYYIVKTKETYQSFSGALFISVKADNTYEILGTRVTDERTPYVIEDADERMNVRLSCSVDIKDDEYAIIYRFHKGKYRQVSIMDDNNQRFDDTVYDIATAPELDFANFAKITGVIQYVTTFYNSLTGAESAPSPLSDEEDFGVNGSLNTLLTDIPTTTDPQVTDIRLYRIGGNLTNFSLVATIPLNAISWYDFNKIDGRVLTTSGYGVPDKAMKYITESNSMLFGAVGTKLYFTLIDKPYAWPALYFINFGHEITGIVSTSQGLLVMTRRKTYVVSGTSPSTLSKDLLSGSQGCVNHKSIQQFGASAIWVSEDGICVMSGGVIQVMSKVALGKINIAAVVSALHDEVYYVMDNLRQIYVADFRYGPIFKKLSLPFSSITVGADRLYGWTGGLLHELFQSEEYSKFHYKSPLFIEGRATQNKYCKNVYLYVNGDIIIKVYLNGQLSIEKRFTGNDNMQLKLPDKNCLDIQFEIEGTGEVREIFVEFGANNAS